MTWYEDDVRAVEQLIKETPAPLGRTVFYGSSSIRLWKTLDTDFSGQSVLNLGFGGSTLASCDWFMERLLVPVQPKAVIFYAGDNDLGDGRQPDEVHQSFVAFMAHFQQKLPGVPLTFLSIKISISRWALAAKIHKTNELIRQEILRLPNTAYVDVASLLLDAEGHPRPDCFHDGLHLSPIGYGLWRDALHQPTTAVF
jgi:lysophospholipase L1-like esterase